VSSTIQFGVLRVGSTITLVGEYRVTVHEEVLQELAPVLRRIETHTGEELDTYGGASFAGQALDEFIAELLRVAEYARNEDKALKYFGL
jgi:dihydrofolate reductase